MRVSILLFAWGVASNVVQQPINSDPTAVLDADTNSVWTDVKKAIWTMQHDYFEVWIGFWPTAIDWTAAVMSTHLSATMHTFALSLASQINPTENYYNEINKYFTQIVSYFYNEDDLSLRNQANDDMLWVVLGWLESVRFMKMDTMHHRDLAIGGNDTWYGMQFAKPFAHKARIFYNLAAKGWDDSTCGGGMIWNPRLVPYKNAITNQLFITASISMYLYFPGDKNMSPFSESPSPWDPYPPHEDRYKQNAIEAYDWLLNSDMVNSKGLYIDGFHIRRGECTIRNEMVYTYNQGVILSGLRGLWEATGNKTYLEHAYSLIQNTINATGYDSRSEPNSPLPSKNFEWKGLGRLGILEDFCDAMGSCNQDAQAFKGIFFHHLARFCDPLPGVALLPNKTHAASPELIADHKKKCASHMPWVERNAWAARRTRDAQGRFGMWWTAAYVDEEDQVMLSPLPPNAEDYRNRGLGPEKRWGRGWIPGGGVVTDTRKDFNGYDLNDRGRGRTVESQSGGLAVVRTLWELILHTRNT